ncbi:MAG: ABC-F family ATP-binding cassette domain-containing protein [Alphaproteobacteria bacterium]
METPPIYTLKNVYLSFGLHPLFTGLELHIGRADKTCLIGRNGSGKSTLLKIIAGLLEPDQGEVFIQPGTRISYMPQENDFSGFSTLKEVVLSGLSTHRQDDTYRADILIESLNMNGNENPATASGGERKKAALARALISEPDILLLDEPTNHLDIATIEKLEDIINAFQGAVIVISHDRAFLNHISTSTLWLDRGILRANKKGFADFEAWQEQVIEQEIIEQKNLLKHIEEETEWLHKGVTARRKRNMGRLRRLQQLRAQRKEQIKQTGSVNLEIDKGSILSKLIIETKHLSKSFGTREIVRDFSIRILRGNKIGIVGPNGAGKTTLIKLMTKRLEPDSGFVRIAKNLEEAYFDQNRLTLDPKKTLWKTLCPEGDHILVRGHSRHVVAYLKDFLFTSAQAKTPVGALSGGEKNRLMLAVALAKPSNFLVLDEPTNDLDMDTLDLLQEALDEYTGTILIVSHDRDFLDKVATSLLYMKGDGSITEYVGTYSDLLEELKKIPHRPTKAKSTSTSPIKQNGAPTIKEKKKKLSFNQQYRLKTLPDEIKALETRIRLLEEKLNNPSFYTENATLFTKTGIELTALKAHLESAETEWLELQLLQDEISQG